MPGARRTMTSARSPSPGLVQASPIDVTLRLVTLSPWTVPGAVTSGPATRYTRRAVAPRRSVTRTRTDVAVAVRPLAMIGLADTRYRPAGRRLTVLAFLTFTVLEVPLAGPATARRVTLARLPKRSPFSTTRI